MTMQFAFGEPSFEGPAPDSAAEQLQAHAREVMADLAGASAGSLDELPRELPVEAAVACGNCRLYGGVAPQIVFPAWLAEAAARRLILLLDQAERDAARLPELWEESTGDEAEDLVAGLVQARMDAWAALVQLEDVLEHCSDTADREALEAAMDEFEAALDRFDHALFQRQDYLSTLAGTHLLTNFRGMLAAEHSDPLPWWLDGRLEAQVAAIDAETDRLIDEMLFQRKATAPSASRPTIADLRAEATLAYAAAAAAEQTSEPSLLQQLRWRSPAGDAFADVVLPPQRRLVPERIVLDFTDAAGDPAVVLVGQPCSLAGVAAVIERREVEGEVRATANFPAAAFFGVEARVEDGDPLALVVGAPGMEWGVEWA
jgi:hypothetical protein